MWNRILWVDVAADIIKCSLPTVAAHYAHFIQFPAYLKWCAEEGDVEMSMDFTMLWLNSFQETSDVGLGIL